LGNVLPQYFSAGENADARRLAIGNLVMRGLACLALVPALPSVSAWLAAGGGDVARQVANFHTGFNLFVAVIFVGLLEPISRLCARAIPVAAAVDASRPIYLDRARTTDPHIALADAARETLRLVDLLESMLSDLMAALRADDRKALGRLSRTDDAIDELFQEIKLYLAELARAEPTDALLAMRCADTLAFATNLEHAGDIVEKSLREIAAKMIRRRLRFSAEGFREISEMHDHVVAALRLAAAVFVSQDIDVARQLLAKKEKMRALEKSATENHFRRLQEGRPETIETSALHCDVARDLKRISAHLAAVALPLLERNGVLLKSRLVS
jgi:phosphate:Na+ symporter